MTDDHRRCSACAGHPRVVWELLCAIHALFEDDEVLSHLRVLPERDANEPLEP